MNLRHVFTHIIAAIGVAAALTACGGAGPSAGDALLAEPPRLGVAPPVPADGAALPFVAIAAGGAGTDVWARNSVIRDRAAWAAFWAADQQRQATPAALPEIDFASKMVVAVTVGGVPCSRLDIDAVRMRAGRIAVEYSVTPPAAGVACAAVIAYPRRLIVLDRYDLPLVFVDSGSGAVEASFQTIAASAITGITRPRQVVVRDLAGWTALWAEYVGTPPVVTPAPPLPGVDFTRYMVIGVFSGAQPNLCHGVDVTRVDERAGSLHVAYALTAPAPLALCMTSIATPGQLILVPLSDGTVQFLAGPAAVSP